MLDAIDGEVVLVGVGSVSAAAHQTHSSSGLQSERELPVGAFLRGGGHADDTGGAGGTASRGDASSPSQRRQRRSRRRSANGAHNGPLRFGGGLEWCVTLVAPTPAPPAAAPGGAPVAAAHSRVTTIATRHRFLNAAANRRIAGAMARSSEEPQRGARVVVASTATARTMLASCAASAESFTTTDAWHDEAESAAPTSGAASTSAAGGRSAAPTEPRNLSLPTLTAAGGWRIGGIDAAGAAGAELAALIPDHSRDEIGRVTDRCSRHHVTHLVEASGLGEGDVAVVTRDLRTERLVRFLLLGSAVQAQRERLAVRGGGDASGGATREPVARAVTAKKAANVAREATPPATEPLAAQRASTTPPLERSAAPPPVATTPTVLAPAGFSVVVPPPQLSAVDSLADAMRAAMRETKVTVLSARVISARTQDRLSAQSASRSSASSRATAFRDTRFARRRAALENVQPAVGRTLSLGGDSKGVGSGATVLFNWGAEYAPARGASVEDRSVDSIIIYR